MQPDYKKERSARGAYIAAMEAQIEKQDQIIQTQEELTRTRRDMVRARNHWFEVFEDLEKECWNKVEKLEKQLRAVRERALKAERQRDEALDKLTYQRQKIYELETELEKEKGKNLRLQSQLNHDHENSSLPSSRTLQRKKITNNREKTGRKPGGQPGHKGHIRKKQEPTAPVIVLPPPQKILDDPEFKKTSRRLKKQMVNNPFGSGSNRIPGRCVL